MPRQNVFGDVKELKSRFTGFAGFLLGFSVSPIEETFSNTFYDDFFIPTYPQ
jgi:hypothetical protein